MKTDEIILDLKGYISGINRIIFGLMFIKHLFFNNETITPGMNCVFASYGEMDVIEMSL